MGLDVEPLQDFSCALHVLVVSTEERCIHYLMQQMNVSREVAEWIC
jgi:hypothetical protein